MTRRQSGDNAVAASDGYVLVVDDDAAFRDLVATLLTRAGLAARTAADGAEGLAAARSERPALVLLEVSLPDINGFELCRDLRDTFGELLPIVFVSGVRTEPFDRAAGLLIGGDDCIVKPADPDELLARVRRLLVRAGGSHPTAPPTTRSGLSPREQQVLELLAEGRHPALIATEFAINVKTVASPWGAQTQSSAGSTRFAARSYFCTPRAGAATLAAALRLRERLESKRIALIASGGNASREQLLDVLSSEHAITTDARHETLSATP